MNVRRIAIASCLLLFVTISSASFAGAQAGGQPSLDALRAACADQKCDIAARSQQSRAIVATGRAGAKYQDSHATILVRAASLRVPHLNRPYRLRWIPLAPRTNTPACRVHWRKRAGFDEEYP